MLDQNRRRYKPKSDARYPYTLSGLTSCAGCGYAMVGKSAHGNGGKIGYYEHSWATKQKSTLVKVAFDCKPCRVLAKQLEPAVWEEVMKLLQRPEVGMGILAQAQILHAKKRKSGERERIEGKVTALQNQLEALAERLAQLPKNVPASLIYQQMEKLQTLKTAEEEKLRGLGDQPGAGDLPAELGSYQRLLDHLQRLTQGADKAEIRSKIIQKLIHKVEVRPEGFRLHYFASQEHVERELAMRAGSRPFTGTNGDKTSSINQAAAESRRSQRGGAKISLISGSNTLTNGAVKAKVCEPRSDIGDLVIVAEFEAWPEPKALTPSVLRELMERFEGSHGAARIIGASEAFVRQNGRETRVRGKKKCVTECIQ